jgi:hypothetical protein
LLDLANDDDDDDDDDEGVKNIINENRMMIN